MSYWEEKKIFSKYSDWLDEYNSSLMCACDHGCNQWISEQATKSLLIHMITLTSGITSLNKVVEMPPEKADKIWRRITSWQMEKFNRELREGKIK